MNGTAGMENGMDDMISRQAAIETVRKAKSKGEAHRMLIQLLPAQPELIEKMAYIRGFEQGRTQGMIDSQGGKK